MFSNPNPAADQYNQLLSSDGSGQVYFDNLPKEPIPFAEPWIQNVDEAITDLHASFALPIYI